MIVRDARPDDFEQWLPLWDGYNVFYGREGPTALPIEITRLTWDRFFDAYEPMHAVVAEQDGRLVGLVHYLFHRSTILRSPTCYLQDLFTSKDARGRGTGRALINAVYDRARTAGATRVYWQTFLSNAVARVLYDDVAEWQGAIVYRKEI